MKRRLAEYTALLLLLAFLGLVVVASGLVPVKASPGHWAITRAFLTFAMRRSVETHSIGIDVPDLDDLSLVLRGAGHYDRSCQPCHGAPGEPGAVILQELTPQPPYLPEVIPLWEPAELFEIVLHGVKMTGMPAWPALDREDEVWAVVAFLVRLADMDAEEYDRLTGDELATGYEDLALGGLGSVPREVTASCIQCHGEEGLGRGVGAFPKIAGQSPAYLAAALAAYATGERNSGIMQPVAAALDEETILELARYYGSADTPGSASTPGSANDPAAGGRATVDPLLLAEGARIAREGIPSRKVPACTDCHGPSDQPRDPYYPALAGQYEEYLTLQLRLFREERRGGSEYVEIMQEAAHSLDEEEARAVAAWYASLPWEP